MTKTNKKYTLKTNTKHKRNLRSNKDTLTMRCTLNKKNVPKKYFVVKSQNNLSTCGAASMMYQVEYIIKKVTGMKLNPVFDPRFVHYNTTTNASKIKRDDWLYSCCKKKEDMWDQGVNMLDCLRAMMIQGCLEVDKLPDSEEDIDKDQISSHSKYAVRNKVVEYGMITETDPARVVELVKILLAHDILVNVVLRFCKKDSKKIYSYSSVYETFTKSLSSKDTGHYITLVGFDDSKKEFKYINSWGKKWGVGGFSTLPYDCVGHNKQITKRDMFFLVSVTYHNKLYSIKDSLPELDGVCFSSQA